MRQHIAVRTPGLETRGRPRRFPSSAEPAGEGPDPTTRHVYVTALETLREAGVEYLIGGAHALGPYTGILRDTKDLDVFLRQADCERALAALDAAGFVGELTFPHWLGKAYSGDRFIDLIFGSGNGVAVVDDAWFTHAVPGQVLGVPVLLCPAEEMIWSKAFIMERERYDGADVAHLILACGRKLDWHRLLARFGRRWRVLLSHLILFGFIYPDERSTVPDAVLDLLVRRLHREQAWTGGEETGACDGTLLSRQQYLVDVTERGYGDGRLEPRGEMTAADIAHWTAAIPDLAPTPPAAPGPGLAVVRSNGRRGPGARRRRR
jgi:hypothetical protein